MAYDFDTIIDRQGKDAVAFDYEASRKRGSFGPRDVDVLPGFDLIPMWVADMNFATAPTISEEIIRRAQHPCFGYFRPTTEYFDAIIGWQREHNGVEITREDIGYENGVLGGVASALRVVCSQGDGVLVHSPTYIGFTEVLSEAGYRIVHSPLVRDTQGIWRMDLKDMETRIRKGHIHAVVFCSPHNPTGRVWTRAELLAAMDLFERLGVWVISDEIWSDLVLDGHHHIPVQSVCSWAHSHTVALYAPSKTFSLAGLVGAYHVIYNPSLRDRVRKEARLSAYNSMNVLSMHALIGAYMPAGAQWLRELLVVLANNAEWACEFIRQRWSGVVVTKPEGTYMLWLDCSDWCAAHGWTISELEAAGLRVGVLWQDGRAFGGDCCIRMNLALPHARLVEAFSRLDEYVFCAH